MHVNNYFIETLVLCFSCGCEQGTLNFGNLGYPGNTTATCSMNTPTRMIIGKQVHWSDKVGEQCDSDGPLQYDLPAIKEIVRLQFVTPPPSCFSDAYEKESLKEEQIIDDGPTQPPDIIVPTTEFDSYDVMFPPTESTTPPSVLGSLSRLNETLVYNKFPLEVQMKNNQSHETEIVAWLEKYPYGQVFVIITAGETSDQNWPNKVNDILLEDFNDDNPTFTIIMDWSKYVFDDYSLTLDYSNLVSKYLITRIREVQIPVEKLTIIAFGTSAHVAGYIGKLSQSMYDETIYRIIALNPTGLFYTDRIPVEHMLNKYDATMVMVLYTETDKIGHCCDVGTINVIVNNPGDGQPWCDNDAECSHESAIKIFILSYHRRPVLVTKKDTNELLVGFPLEVSASESGTYYLITNQQGFPLKEIETTTPTTRANLDFLDLAFTTLHNNFSVSAAIHSNQSHEAGVEAWVSIHPDGQVFLIVDGGESADEQWPQKVHEILLDASAGIVPILVLVVNWAKYVSTDMATTANYAHRIADDQANLIVEAKIPLKQVTIMGFGMSSHVAGLIGKMLQHNYGETIYRIISLNPANVFSEEERLTKYDAVMVMVIYTETSEIGYCCGAGTVEVIVNNPREGQPWCRGNAQCSHESAIRIFILSYVLHPILIVKEGTNEVLDSFPLNVDPSITGTYILMTENDVPKHLDPKQVSQHENYARLDWPAPSKTMFPDLKVDDMQIIAQVTSQEGTLLLLNQESDYVTEFLKSNLMAEIFIIVTEQPSTQWADLMREALLSTAGPKIVLIVDWSMYVNPSYLYTASHSFLIAEKVSELIKTYHLQCGLLEIIGFSISAHIAGMVGEIVKKSGDEVSRITALDPEYRAWANSNLMVSESSANIVQVIHTNTRYWGNIKTSGTHNIYVNGGAVQPQCVGSESEIDYCSHLLALEYFIESIATHSIAKEAVLQAQIAIRSGYGTILFGYHLIPKPKQGQPGNNRFILETNHYQPYLIDNVPVYKNPQPDLVVESKEWQAISFVPIEILTDLVLHIYFLDERVPKKMSVCYNGRHPKFVTILRKIIHVNPRSKIYLIIDGEDVDQEEWGNHLGEKIMEKKIWEAIVMRVDWSRYKHSRSYSLSASYSKPIGRTLADIFMHMEIEFAHLYIIGFSIGAHIAGFVGKEVQALYPSKIGRISALDPARPMFNHPDVSNVSRLSSEDAAFVDVYHTNIFVYGYTEPLGTMDFYVNNGFIQPDCPSEDHVCSHNRAIELFIESLDIKARAVQVKYEGDANLVFIEETKFADFGFFYTFGTPGVYYIHTATQPPYLQGSSIITKIGSPILPTVSSVTENIPQVKDVVSLNTHRENDQQNIQGYTFTKRFEITEKPSTKTVKFHTNDAPNSINN